MPLPITNEPEASTSNSEDFLINIENIQTDGPNSELAIVSPDALNTVIHYYLDGKGHPPLKKVLLDQFLLSLVAFTGAGLYGEASDDYAVSIGAELAGRINYIACTCITALVVLYNSTELFLVMRRGETIPKELIPYLTNSTTGIKKILEDIAIFTGAAISALPLAAVSFMYPIPGFSKTLLLIQGIIVLIDNTILHLFPLKLALSEPLYRLPSLPFEFIIQQMMSCRLSAEEKEKKQLQTQIDKLYHVIIQRFVDNLDRAQKHLEIHMKEVKGDIASIKKSHQSEEMLIALLNRLYCMTSSDQPRTTSSNVRNILRTLSYLPGALWVISSCVGFLVAPINEMIELTGSPALGAAISTPPVYFLGVLLAFFGGNALQNTFDYFTDWTDEAVKIRMPFKLYPKTAALLIIISMYLASFSYAAGVQLINDNFKGDLAFLRTDLLIFLAKTGLGFLSFTAMINFFEATLDKFAKYAGNDDARMVTKLFSEFDQIKKAIQKMKADLFLESLALKSKEELKTLLNIGDETDQENLSETLTQLAEKLKTKIIKEIRSIDATNILDSEDYNIEKIESLLFYFDTEAKLNLPSSLKEACQEYKAVCELMKKLGSLSLSRELNIFPHDSINNSDFLAGSSSETTPLLPRRTLNKGSILTRFFHPSKWWYGNEARPSSFSSSTSFKP